MLLLFTATPAGALVLVGDWPTGTKQKHCYFVKKSRDHVAREQPVQTQLHYGDLGSSPVQQLATFVDEV